MKTTTKASALVPIEQNLQNWLLRIPTTVAPMHPKDEDDEDTDSHTEGSWAHNELVRLISLCACYGRIT